MGISVAVAGASGYVGGELLRLVSGHPEFSLVAATGQEAAGRPLARVHPHLDALADVVLGPTDPAVLTGADLVFLALPMGRSAALAAALPADVPVVDLGPDHRLRDPADWARHYPGPAARPWTYGLPELPGQRAAIAAASRVAGTGCFAAAVILGLAPLLDAGLIEPDDVVVVAASGTSGAGRTARTDLLATEVLGGARAYRVGGHQHVPEIKQATGAGSVSFSPVIAPMPRGILATVTGRPAAPAAGAERVRSVLAAAYAGEPFVRVLPPGRWPGTAAVSGSNACHLQGTVDADSGRVLVVSALDNLGKGAAGQAVQCANLMLGLPETMGLSATGVAP